MPDLLPAPIRLLIVASSPLARAGLAALLSHQERVNIVGQVSESDLPDAIPLYRPDLLVWDMGWEPLLWLDKLNEVAGGRDAPATLALLADERGANAVVSALIAAGVRAFLPQTVDAQRLTAAITAADRDLLVLPPALFESLLPSALTAPILTPAESLTPREAEVLNLIAEGLPNKTIATRLTISEHTVKFHVNAILTKLGAQSRTEAVVRATRLGLIAL